MNPIDFRNETFDGLRARLCGARAAVLHAWRGCGPGTTRDIAARTGLSLLTFRPRTTELLQMGLLTLAETQDAKGEGVYRARSDSEWLAWLAAQRHAAADPQLQLM
jgi:hypothetical protein